MTALVDPEHAINSEFDLNLTQSGTTVSLVLCDGRGKRNTLAFTRDPIRRNSMKLYQGQQKYSDMEPPWTPIAQTDWSGGRGSKDFEKDTTMYYDSIRVNTVRPGEIILGPKATGTFNTTISNASVGTIGGLSQVSAATVYYAFKYTPASTLTTATVDMPVKVDEGQLYLGIGHMTGTPDPDEATIDWSTNYATPSDTGGMMTFTFNVAHALTSGVDHCIVLKWITTVEMVDLEYLRSATNNSYWQSTNGTTWSTVTATPPPAFTAYPTAIDTKPKLFEYKGALYAVSINDDASTSKLYLNGDQGVVKTGGSVTSVIADSGVKTWAEDEAIGCVMKIVAGSAAAQPQPWRPITDNLVTDVNGETTFTVAPAFDVAPAAGDIFAIVASDDWTEVVGFDTNYKTASSGITPRVTDVLAVNGAVYFAMGDGQVLTRMYAYSNAGAWTYDYSTFGTYTGSVAETGKFTHLAYGSDQTGTYIFGAKGGYPSTVAKAPAVDYTAASPTPAALVFATAENVGDLWEQITGIEVYGEYGNLFAFKEGSIWFRMDGNWYKTDIREMENTRDNRNGRAHMVHGMYLYFSWHNTVERYYSNLVDGVGPEQAEVGTPDATKAGHFSSLVGYPGLVIGAVDAGTSGYSTILAYNGVGWCEWYAGAQGARIQSLYVQSIPGNKVDRLWAGVGSDIVWLPLSVDPFNHPDSSYYFTDSGYLITSWYYLGLQDIDKLYNSLKMVVENTSSTSGAEERVALAYQKDGDTTWTDVTGYYDSFSEELDLASTPSVTGKRIRFKFTLSSHDGANTPRIVATILEAITRLPNKYITTVTARLDPDDPDDYTSALTKFNALTTMQDAVLPVTVESLVDMLDGKTAFIDGLTPRGYKAINKNGRTSYVIQFSLIEI
jgi:hypothetical protein